MLTPADASAVYSVGVLATTTGIGLLVLKTAFLLLFAKEDLALTQRVGIRLTLAGVAFQGAGILFQC